MKEKFEGELPSAFVSSERVLCATITMAKTPSICASSGPREVRRNEYWALKPLTSGTICDTSTARAGARNMARLCAVCGIASRRRPLLGHIISFIGHKTPCARPYSRRDPMLSAAIIVHSCAFGSSVLRRSRRRTRARGKSSSWMFVKSLGAYHGEKRKAPAHKHQGLYVVLVLLAIRCR